ncbi:MAG: DUF2244 domain-containing protein [Acetobacteraceae bacterium]|nr:DUF2244 domain-containing protein [Acetobacteraceae bacterium]
MFEATTTPPAGLSPRAARLLGMGVVAASAAVGAFWTMMGAWPILGFVGAEAALVLTLLALHQRWSRRMSETLRLADGRITIRRTDWRGRREEVVLAAYWTRLSLDERPGRVSALMLRHRGGAIEVGGLLGEEQKRDLAEALADALRRYRAPVFDNPQLRDLR